MFSNFVFRKSWRLWHNFVKCGRARDATDDSIIQHMHAHCMLEDYGYIRHSEYVILMDFQRQKWLRELAILLLLQWLFFTNFAAHLCTDMPVNTNECFWLPDFWARLCSKCSSWVIFVFSPQGGRSPNRSVGKTEPRFLCALCTNPETLKEIVVLLSHLATNHSFRLSLAPAPQNLVLTANQITAESNVNRWKLEGIYSLTKILS